MLRDLTETDVVKVDGVEHRMTELLARRSNTIRLPHPERAPETRIAIPERWRRNVGRPQPHDDVMVFSSAFGGNGGRRLPERSALQTSVDYYIVGNERRLKNLNNYFDFATEQGRIEDGPLLVYQVRVGASSARLEKATRWLENFGYCVSDYDSSAQLMWPPSLRSWGVDEPLFRRSSPVYRSPYQFGGKPIPDHIITQRFLPKDPRAREVGLLGFANPDITSEKDSYCVFFKPTERTPWSTVYIGPDYPDDLHPYDEWGQNKNEIGIGTTPDIANATDTTPDETIANAEQPATTIVPADIQPRNGDATETADTAPLPLGDGARIARQRLGIREPARQPRSRSTIIAQLRERM
ncbi:hypothetical protein [Bifidobacterium saguinibicoloris]|uniref:hypothetical protein n=1 Tax=Bifidobacterium saguinibicoloris TaxID=2834433 RepID=UPI001C55EF7F|nr:hypothetical protein [Bifidobacterium saguinibicoloris]MBW3080153.1 hypothetical protein [Bifidobacterium saguinibicoloris]